MQKSVTGQSTDKKPRASCTPPPHSHNPTKNKDNNNDNNNNKPQYRTDKSMETIKVELIRGKPIQIIGGKNKGHKGWFNAGNPLLDKATVKYIIDLTHKNKGYQATWAKKKNIGPVRSIHQSYWEALLHCAPNVEQKMNKLAEDLVECQLRDIKDATDYLEKEFKEQKEIMREKIGKGKVKVCHIIHEPNKQIAERKPNRSDPMDSV